MNKSVLIDKVLSGDASPEEQEELQLWIDSDERNKSEFNALKDFKESFLEDNEEEEDSSFHEDFNAFDKRIQRIKVRKRRVRTFKRVFITKTR